MLTSRGGFLRQVHWLAAVLIGCLVGPSFSFAQEAGGFQVTAVNGALLGRADSGWQSLKANESAANPGTTLVALFEADLKCNGGAVTMKMIGDIGAFGPLSVLDSAVRILDPGMMDASLALQRGVIVLTNTKSAGAATVRLKVRGEDVELKLKSPGTKVGIELHGRHPGGAAHILKDEPTTFVYVLVGNGDVVITTKANTYALSGPPGPALLRWDSVTKQAEVEALEKFPPELIRNEKEKEQFAKICAAAEAFNGKDPKATAAKLVKSDDALARRAAVTAMGALDDVSDLLDALDDAQHKDVREQAILVLRAWIGRSSGQLKPFRAAMLNHKYRPVQMTTTMHLLFGFEDHERQRPAMYELLIQMLDSKHVSVRELAHWHLVRLAPAGRDIPFDAGAADADRQRGVERWRQLIPEGSLPPARKTEKQ